MTIYEAKIRITHASLGGFGSNTWHIRVSDPPVLSDESTVNALMGDVHDFYGACVGSLPDTGSWYFDGQVEGVGSDAGEHLNVDAWTQAGGSPGNALPPANAIVVNWFGASGDRSKRGRTFMGPCAVGALDTNGTVAATQLNAMRAAATALVDASEENSGGALGIYSRQEEVIRDFVGSSVRDQFAVLRSRRD